MYKIASITPTASQNCIGKKKHTLANQTTPHHKLMEYQRCLSICIVTKPHLGKVCIFLPILFIYREVDTLYMCHSNFIVLLQHISPWTQIWIQGLVFIVAYQNLTFKSVKQNCCFSNQRWDAVKSRQALKRLHQIDQSECNIFFARIYQTPIWIGTKINLFLIGIFSYKPVDMPHKWIGLTPK